MGLDRGSCRSGRKGSSTTTHINNLFVVTGGGDTVDTGSGLLCLPYSVSETGTRPVRLPFHLYSCLLRLDSPRTTDHDARCRTSTLFHLPLRTETAIPVSGPGTPLVNGTRYRLLTVQLDTSVRWYPLRSIEKVGGWSSSRMN